VKVHIDFSVMSETEAFGYIHGPIELPSHPRAGDDFSFTKPGPVINFPLVKDFSGRLKVEHVTFQPGQDIEIALSLSDLIVGTRDEARRVASYFEDSYGLYWDEFE
jgi:hypothetical protein